MLHNLKKFSIIVIGIICIILVLNIFNIPNFILKQLYPIKYSEYVEKYSQKNNLDKFLVYSIIKTESNFKQDATSSSGAKGLMQLMEATATEISSEIDEPMVEAECLFEPEKNIMLGTKYYTDLLQKYNGNTSIALAAYNAGKGNVDNWIEQGIIKEDGSDIENIPFKETNMYVRKTINNYERYKNLYK